MYSSLPGLIKKPSTNTVWWLPSLCGGCHHCVVVAITVWWSPSLCGGRHHCVVVAILWLHKRKQEKESAPGTDVSLLLLTVQEQRGDLLCVISVGEHTVEIGVSLFGFWLPRTGFQDSGDLLTLAYGAVAATTVWAVTVSWSRSVKPRPTMINRWNKNPIPILFRSGLRLVISLGSRRGVCLVPHHSVSSLARTARGI